MNRFENPIRLERFSGEDILIGKAVVTVLNKLTGRRAPLPTEATKAGCKAEGGPGSGVKGRGHPWKS